MNSKIIETSNPHRLLRIKLRKSDKYVALPNLSIFYTWKKIKKSYKYNKFKITAPTGKGEFELLDGSYSIEMFKVILNIY